MDIFATHRHDPKPDDQPSTTSRRFADRVRRDFEALSDARLVEFSGIEDLVTAISKAAAPQGIDRLVLYFPGRGAHLASPSGLHHEAPDDWTLLSIPFGEARLDLRSFDRYRPPLAELANLMNPGAQAIFLGVPVGRDPVLLHRFSEAWGIPCTGSLTPPWRAEALDIGGIQDGPWMTATPNARFRQRERCPAIDLDDTAPSEPVGPDTGVLRGRVS